MNYLNLKEDGLKIIINFLSLEEISLLEKELAPLLMPSFNDSSGCCILKKNYILLKLLKIFK